MIAEVLDKFVRERADDRCEYCRLPQSKSRLRHQIEHVIARQHGGASTADNLALACVRCNLKKGPNIAGLDPSTGNLTPLFNPRSHVWEDHFSMIEKYFVGLTPIGTVTILVLGMNERRPAAVRDELEE